MVRSDRRINFTDAAKRDIAEIRTYTLKEWGERQRDAYLAKLETKFTQLCAAPELGGDRSWMMAGVRSHSAGSHIIYYQDTGKKFTIVRVLHKSMDAERHLSTWKN